jgi:hypothetical protein
VLQPRDSNGNPLKFYSPGPELTLDPLGYPWTDPTRATRIPVTEIGSSDVDPSGHGTQMASLLVGRTLGVVPRATLVPVRIRGKGIRLPTSADEGPSIVMPGICQAALVQGLQYIENDIRERGSDQGFLSQKSVILLAAGLITLNLDKPWGI